MGSMPGPRRLPQAPTRDPPHGRAGALTRPRLAEPVVARRCERRGLLLGGTSAMIQSVPAGSLGRTARSPEAVVKQSANRREDPIFGELPRGTVESNTP